MPCHAMSCHALAGVMTVPWRWLSPAVCWLALAVLHSPHPALTSWMYCRPPPPPPPNPPPHPPPPPPPHPPPTPANPSTHSTHTTVCGCTHPWVRRCHLWPTSSSGTTSSERCQVGARRAAHLRAEPAWHADLPTCCVLMCTALLLHHAQLNLYPPSLLPAPAVPAFLEEFAREPVLAAKRSPAQRALGAPAPAAPAPAEANQHRHGGRSRQRRGRGSRADDSAAAAAGDGPGAQGQRQKQERQQQQAAVLSVILATLRYVGGG